MVKEVVHPQCESGLSPVAERLASKQLCAVLSPLWHREVACVLTHRKYCLLQDSSEGSIFW